MSVRLEGVTAGYGATVVLRDVTLAVPAGSAVALLGPNGAGKSTLLSVVSGLVAPRRGRVLIRGVDVGGERTDSRSRAGLCHVTESGAIFPALTVADNLRVFSHRGANSTGGLEPGLSAFPRLAERLNQVAGTLSGGEQRMLALARIYAAGASVVLVDEVSLGLAPTVVDEIFAFLARLSGEGVTLLIVEQYVSRVLAIADLAYVLARGRIAFAGEPAELDAQRLQAEYLGTATASTTSATAMASRPGTAPGELGLVR